MKKAIYAGSFDPITKGHLDIIQQGREVFDQIVIAVGVNPAKPNRCFPLEQSLEMIASACEDVHISPDAIDIHSFEGALIRYAEKIGADAILRGLRQVSDFDSEFRLHAINALVGSIPQVYMICDTRYLHVSSSTVKEMESLDLPIGDFVTQSVLNAFYDRRAD